MRIKHILCTLKIAYKDKIEISKTSEAHRKMRNHRKMETQNQPGVQRYTPSMESVPAEEINWLS